MKPSLRRVTTGRLVAACTVVCLLAAWSGSFAQTAPDDSADRQRALSLYKQGKYVEAVPLLEQVAVARPSDLVVKEALAFSLLASAATMSDPSLRSATRLRARAIALEAKKLGDNSNLLAVILDGSNDGSDPVFSDRKEVDDAMKAAEADFMRGDLDKARDGYLKALLLDPANYEAALFIGDSYFKQNVHDAASQWFLRAVQIAPDRETAYRYWGDSLFAAGRDDEARGKYIEAVVAEPFNRRATMGLSQWATRNKVVVNMFRLKDGAAVSQQADKSITVTIDSGLSKDGPAAAAWMAYAMNRALWRTRQFATVFPNEPTYRRTLREEAESLHAMVQFLAERKDPDPAGSKLDPALIELIRIDKAGLLEPFVLFTRVDAEIAKDYAAYRAANRVTLIRYWDEIVVPRLPAK